MNDADAQIEFHPIDRTLKLFDRQVQLTGREAELVSYLLARRGTIVERTELERDVWGFGPQVRSEAVPVMVRSIRQRMGPAGRWLKTIRGRGWCLEACPDGGSARSEEVALRRALSQGHRLITLVGPLGSGRGHLMARVAEDVDDLVLCPDGVEPSTLRGVSPVVCRASAPMGVEGELVISVGGLSRSSFCQLLTTSCDATLSTEDQEHLHRVTDGLPGAALWLAYHPMGAEDVLGWVRERGDLPPSPFLRDHEERFDALGPASHVVLALLDELPYWTTRDIAELLTQPEMQLAARLATCGWTRTVQGSHHLTHVARQTLRNSALKPDVAQRIQTWLVARAVTLLDALERRPGPAIDAVRALQPLMVRHFAALRWEDALTVLRALLRAGEALRHHADTLFAIARSRGRRSAISRCSMRCDSTTQGFARQPLPWTH